MIIFRLVVTKKHKKKIMNYDEKHIKAVKAPAMADVQKNNC